MRVSHDVYAELNPAFCAAVLAEFTKSFYAAQVVGPELPLTYLALPVVLSDELAYTFDSTNKNTGLLPWIERSPQVRVGLAERVNASMDIVTAAIRFGCFARVLTIGDGARLLLGERKLAASAISDAGSEAGRTIKRAGRLAYWFATAGSTRSVFDAMGLSV